MDAVIDRRFDNSRGWHRNRYDFDQRSTHHDKDRKTYCVGSAVSSCAVGQYGRKEKKRRDKIRDEKVIESEASKWDMRQGRQEERRRDDWRLTTDD